MASLSKKRREAIEDRAAEIFVEEILAHNKRIEQEGPLLTPIWAKD